MGEEIWKSVISDSNYQVSNLGRIRGITRSVRTARGGIRTAEGRIIKPFISKKTGYLQVNLTNKMRKNFHVLIAEAFLGERKNNLVVNHKNGCRLDNRADNLEWVTQKENMIHSYRFLGRVGSCNGKFGEYHPASKAVICEDKLTGDKKIYLSAMDAVREGFYSASISRCCNGVINHHKGKYWSFYDVSHSQIDEVKKLESEA